MKHRIILILILLLLPLIFRLSTSDANPPGLYWDEVAIGYDSYSVFMTGKDIHGQNFPLFFESLGDWKLPGYFYLTVPSIAAFGLNEFAVRFPSAFFGTLTIPIFYLLVLSQTKNRKLATAAALLLAISPWHIQFSRAAFESSVGLFFFLLAFYLFTLSLNEKRTKLLIFAIILFSLTQYIYHSYRILTPLFLVGLGLIYKDQLLKIKKILAASAAVFLIISAPVILFNFSPHGQTRATSQSAFRKEEAEKSKIDFDQKSKKPLRFLSGYIFPQPLYYSQITLKNYLDHFSLVFLFLKGDQIGRHSLVDIGQLHVFEAILIIIGVFSVKKIKAKHFIKSMVLLLFLAPIPAAIVTPSPHANRALAMVVPLTFLSAVGANYIISLSKKIVKWIFFLWVLTVLSIYLHLLLIHYPKKFAADWQDGYRQMVTALNEIEDSYEKVFITNVNNIPHLYVAFYKEVDPHTIQNVIAARGFEKYHFVGTDADIYDQGKALFVAPPWQQLNGKLILTISDNFGRPVYKFWELGGQN